MDISQLSRLIAMSDMATAKRSIASDVKDRAKSGKCLHCETEATRRGLCMRHYFQFVRQLQAKPKGDRVEFETTCIREGKILASNEIKRINQVNPFVDVG